MNTNVNELVQYTAEVMNKVRQDYGIDVAQCTNKPWWRIVIEFWQCSDRVSECAFMVANCIQRPVPEG